MQSEVSFAALVRQFNEMQKRGTPPVAAEVGPETWKFMLDTAEAGTGRAWPPGLKESAKEGHFMGISVRPGDVPEGKLWPLETVND